MQQPNGTNWRMLGELRNFGKDMCSSFVANICGGVLTASLAIATSFGFHPPEWLIWSWISVAFFIGAFVAYRKQLHSGQDLRVAASKESANLHLQIKELQSEKEERSLLSLSRESPQLLRHSTGQRGHILITVTNTSKSKSANKVELVAMSVAPKESSTASLPAQVSLPPASHQVIIYQIDHLAATDSVEFAVLEHFSNTFALNTKNSHGATIDLSKFGHVSIKLRAQGKDITPSFATLKLTAVPEQSSTKIELITGQ